jgi:hypothetical protein
MRAFISRGGLFVVADLTLMMEAGAVEWQGGMLEVQDRNPTPVWLNRPCLSWVNKLSFSVLGYRIVDGCMPPCKCSSVFGVTRKNVPQYFIMLGIDAKKTVNISFFFFKLEVRVRLTFSDIGFHSVVGQQELTFHRCNASHITPFSSSGLCLHKYEAHFILSIVM